MAVKDLTLHLLMRKPEGRKKFNSQTVSSRQMSATGYSLLKEGNSGRQALFKPATQAIVCELVGRLWSDSASNFEEIFGSFEAVSRAPSKQSRKDDDGASEFEEYQGVVYEPRPDPHRHLITLENFFALCPKLLSSDEERHRFALLTKELTGAIAQVGQGLGPAYFAPLSSVTLLASSGGGEAQAWHTDFSADDASIWHQLDPSHPPAFGMVPFSTQSASLDVRPGAVGVPKESGQFFFGLSSEPLTVSLSSRDILFAHGYLVHRGCGYLGPELNVRLHFYLLPIAGRSRHEAGEAHRSTGHVEGINF